MMKNTDVKSFCDTINWSLNYLREILPPLCLKLQLRLSLVPIRSNFTKQPYVLIIFSVCIFVFGW